MSYFENVYLKRLNKDGNTTQERVKTRKENEFNKLFLKRTEYQANIYQVDDNEANIICSLQPNKWNESQLISNLLIPTEVSPLKTGNILKIFQKIKDKEFNKIWLVLFKEENLTKGYQTYKIICLDEEISIDNEYGDTLYTIPIKFVNSTSSLVKDYFAFGDLTYREPNKDIKFITKDFDFLKKDVYFIHKDYAFEISGKDNISIENVAYVTISERLRNEIEPKSSADIRVGENENFFLNNR